MSPFHVLLATSILYFVGITSIVEADPTNSLTKPTVNAINSFGPGRNLRTDNNTTTNSEERVNILVVSSIAAKLSAAKKAKETAKWNQIDDWFEWYWMPVEVKRDLKLGSKFGKKLKKSSNYKFYKAYLARFEGSLDDLLRNKFSTYEVWSMLGLKTTPSNLLKQSDELEVYAKYVNMVDDETISANKLPNPSIDDIFLPVSRAEFVAKLAARTAEKRPEDYGW